MAESAILFDGKTSTERFAQMVGDIARNGVVGGDGQQLNVTATGSVMQVDVGTGAAFVGHSRGTVAQRRHYINGAKVTLAIDAADPTNPRIDRVIVRLNVNETNVADRCKLKILKGTPASSPAIPPLTRSGAVYDIGLAQVRVNAGVTAIGQSNITDEREDNIVCGYINRSSQLLLHNDRHPTHRALWIQGVDSQTGAFVYITRGDGTLVFRLLPDGQLQHTSVVPASGKVIWDGLSGYDGTNQWVQGVVHFPLPRSAAPTVTRTTAVIQLEGAADVSGGATGHVTTITVYQWGFAWRVTRSGTTKIRRVEFDWSV